MSFDLNVSRETLERLRSYEDLLRKWNPAINLISRSGMYDLWNRHIWDCLQVYDLSAQTDDWLDIGSGGGLPGLVVAIVAAEQRPEQYITMIESDSRKATFLRTVIRDLDLRASVIVDRVERVPPVNSKVMSARALADLKQLLAFADRHLTFDGRAFFFKGETWQKEVSEARNLWSFDLVAHKSKSNPQAAILELKDIQLV